LITLFALCAAAHAAPAKVLILSGLNNHNWKATTPVLRAMLAEAGRFAVDVTENPEKLTPDELAKYDVIVSNWNSWKKKTVEKEWSPELRKAYLDFVRNGKGHVVVHAGSCSFYDWPEVHKLYGATWKLGSTGHGPYHDFSVRMTGVKHPITQGVAEFRIKDELWHRPGLQSDVVVLAESFSAKEKRGTGSWEPCLTVNPLGKGRSVTLLLGHDAAAMERDGFKTLFIRATDWAATGAVKGQPSGE